jgi:hypothetical protein
VSPRRLALALGAALVAGAGTAHADTTAQLDFQRRPGAELCPAAPAVRSAVAQRLGFDPFRPDGAKRIRCTVGGDDAGLVARIEVADEAGRVAAERVLTSPLADCRELSDAIVLALSIAINPLLALEPARPPVGGPSPSPAPAGTAAATPPPPPAAPAEVPPAAPAEAPPPIPKPRPVATNSSTSPPASARLGELSLGIDALVAVGLGPGPAFGTGLRVGLGRTRLLLELEVRAVASTSVSVDGGSIVAWAGMVSLAPCARFGAFAACALGSVGGVRAHGEGFALPQTATLPYAAVGARALAQRRLGRGWWVRAAADLNGVVARSHLLLDGEEAWVSPRVNGVLALSAGAHFW